MAEEERATEPDSLPGLMARLVAEYRVHHLVEELPGVNGNRPECVLIDAYHRSIVQASTASP
jgi:hypothetical protein